MSAGDGEDFCHGNKHRHAADPDEPAGDLGAPHVRRNARGYGDRRRRRLEARTNSRCRLKPRKNSPGWRNEHRYDERGGKHDDPPAECRSPEMRIVLVLRMVPSPPWWTLSRDVRPISCRSSTDAVNRPAASASTIRTEASSNPVSDRSFRRLSRVEEVHHERCGECGDHAERSRQRRSDESRITASSAD